MWNGQKNMAARKKTELVETFSFGPWSINAKKGPIITTAECKRYDLITYVTVFFSFFSTHLSASSITLALGRVMAAGGRGS